MAILKLALDVPVEAELKYAKGKYFESKFPGQEGQLMYSLESGECVFLPENMDETFAAANIGANEPFVMCLRKTRSGAKFVEAHRLDDAEVVLDPSRYPDEHGHVTARPSKIETQLAASIEQGQQRKALPSKVAPFAVVNNTSQTQTPSNGTPAAGQTLASQAMASALCAAVDALALAQQYASSKGLHVTFGAEDVRTCAASIFIAASKEPGFLRQSGAAASGANWRQ